MIADSHGTWVNQIGWNIDAFLASQLAPTHQTRRSECTTIIATQSDCISIVEIRRHGSLTVVVIAPAVNTLICDRTEVRFAAINQLHTKG